ncbi:MAG: hypothetical protein ACR2N3_06790 [Pyrinomonadaceae bacterium]
MSYAQNFARGGEQRVYHISPLRRFIPWIVISPIFLLLTPLLTSPLPDERKAGFIAGAFLGALGLMMHLLVSRAKLTVSPEGVKLNQTTFTLETTWDNIAGLQMTRGSERFVTREPPTGKGMWRIDLFLKGKGERVIPIDAFAWHFKHGTLAADISRFAPHLRQTF